MVSTDLRKFLSKISKKNKIFYDKILKKISEIISSENIEHYKNLKYGLKNFKRAHIGHFVLIFRYDKRSNTIFFDNIKHHDFAYRKK